MSDGGYTQAERMLSVLEQQTGRPLRAMLEISDRCNEVCLHCYQVQGQKGELSTEQLKSVMDELAAMGVLILTLSGGEATLRSDLLELIAHARKLGFAVRLFTNGLTMTEALALELKRLAVHLVEISLYSHRADVHDTVTGVARSFERTVAGIRHLRALDVNVHIKTPMMRINEDERDAYIAFAESLSVTYSFDPGLLLPSEAGHREPQRLGRSQAAYEAACSAAAQDDPRYTQAEPVPLPADGAPPLLCGAGQTLHMEPNGELHPCTMLAVSFGNALDGIARTLAQSEAQRGIRALTWVDAHGCRSCAFAAIDCGRCHASALAEVGDALAPYPSACRTALSVYRIRTGNAVAIESRRGVGDAEHGPYRLLSVEGGVARFEAIDDVITPEDEALAARLGWTRRAQGAMPAPDAPVRPGQLVQLRRPGARKARPVQIPASPRSDDSAVPLGVSFTRS